MVSLAQSRGSRHGIRFCFGPNVSPIGAKERSSKAVCCFVIRAKPQRRKGFRETGRAARDKGIRELAGPASDTISVTVKGLLVCGLVCLLLVPLGAVDILPLDQVQTGMHGVGRTVFSGDKVEEFQVEVLGVLKNIGPEQSLILAKLTGGPLSRTGVMAGMSGSPIYFDGKLAGAIAYSFPFTTEPIAGIRPIAEMLNTLGEAEPGQPPSGARAGVARIPLGDGSWMERSMLDPRFLLTPPGPRPAGFEPRLMPVATSAGLAGFSERTLEVFGPQLRGLGLQPVQGISGQDATASGSPRAVEPGSMISVALVRGDLDVSASGTVTHVDGDRLYAFGHRFLSSGPTQMPLMRSSVITIVPNLSNSFKIAGAGAPVGAITEDRSTGVAGKLGQQPHMIPVRIGVRADGGRERRYNLELVDDRFLTPFLVQMAVFSAIDATEHQLGAASFRMTGAVEFTQEGAPPLRLDNMFSGPSSVLMEVATAAAVPLAYLLQSGFEDLSIGEVELAIEASDDERRLDIDRAWLSKTNVRAGDIVELAVALRDPKGAEIVKKTEYRVPAGITPGPLEVTVSDAGTLNAQEWQLFANPRQAASSAQLVEALNRLRRNDRLYVRVWRPSRGFLLQTERLPEPPASVAGLLSIPSRTGGEVREEWQSTLAEVEIDSLGSVVNGQVNTRVTVIE